MLLYFVGPGFQQSLLLNWKYRFSSHRQPESKVQTKPGSPIYLEPTCGSWITLSTGTTHRHKAGASKYVLVFRFKGYLC